MKETKKKKIGETSAKQKPVSCAKPKWNCAAAAAARNVAKMK